MVNCDLVVEPPMTFLIYTFRKVAITRLRYPFSTEISGSKGLRRIVSAHDFGIQASIRAQYLAAIFAIILWDSWRAIGESAGGELDSVGMYYLVL